MTDPRQKLLDELEQLEARRQEIVREFETVTCTGISAGWCPLCGDCICRDEEGDAIDGLDNPDCPLHAFGSPHAEDLPAAMQRFITECRQAPEHGAAPVLGSTDADPS